MTRFIRLRKFESMSLQYVLQGFKMSDCEWLQDSRFKHARSKVRHVPPSASKKQFEILCEFLYWLMEGFMMPLIQAAFYVTDSSSQKNTMFYYRHSLWRKILEPTVSSLKARMFIQLSKEEENACRRPYANVRFLPKTNDLRPIVNLRKKTTRLVNGSMSSKAWSTNQLLLNANQILSCERSRQDFSSSSVGMTDLYYRLKEIKSQLIDPLAANPSKLFFVKVDVQRSFDSIRQDKLMEAASKVLQEDWYAIHRHSKVMPANGQVTKRFVSKAIPATQLSEFEFLEHAYSIAESSKDAILVDKVVHPFESKQTVMNRIQTHVQDNIVKFGKAYYRQTTGIPQGSVLSPSLCRVFYDDMETNHLADLTRQRDSALLRLADDFLFISKSREKATRFLRAMAKGHPEYGCFINEHKTVANFEVSLYEGGGGGGGEGEVRMAERSQGNDFPYCGYLLNTRTLDVRVNFERYGGTDVRNLLTIERTRHPGRRSITLKMKKAMQHQCQLAFADTDFNSLQTVLLNVYQNLVFCCMKFHVYIQELVQDPGMKHHIQKECLAAIVLEIFKVCYNLLHNGRRSAIGLAAGAKFEVAERHVRWLGATAFRSTLPDLTLYEGLKNTLKEQVLVPLNRTEKSYFRRKLSSVVNDERNKNMKGIKYCSTK
ncbi:hypothetical protein BG004_004735 [Podila humilis]|nr:hypothetical protein BG004_004735 [Podila humilis]